MSNISIYLNQELQKKLDILTKEGLVDEVTNALPPEEFSERSRSALIGMIIDKEYRKMQKAQMVADAVIVDRESLGWTEEEQQCQSID